MFAWLALATAPLSVSAWHANCPFAFAPKRAGLIIPVMDRVLGPYLRGGGAKAFNFQALSTDLLVRRQWLAFMHLFGLSGVAWKAWVGSNMCLPLPATPTSTCDPGDPLSVNPCVSLHFNAPMRPFLASHPAPHAVCHAGDPLQCETPP